MQGKEHTRIFKRDQIGFSESELEIILTELMPDKSFGDVYKDCSWFWSMGSDGKRRIIINMLLDAHVVDVTHTTLLATPKQIKLGFGSDGVSNEVIIDRLAHYDFHRMLKWPLISHYQRKIELLSKY